MNRGNRTSWAYLPPQSYSLPSAYPPEEMVAHPVSTRVNNPANDMAECIEPLLGHPSVAGTRDREPNQ